MAEVNANTATIDFHKLFVYENGNLFWIESPNGEIPAGSLAGSIQSNGYVHVLHKGVTYKAHRIIFWMHHGYVSEMVDHINGIPYDNRIENLRASNCLLNNRNRNSRGNSNNKSGHIGVTWHKQSRKWEANIGLDGKTKFLGRFTDKDAAIVCRREAELKYYGENSREN